VNFIYRNDTDRFVPMFEIIYSIELVFIILALIVSFVVFYFGLLTPGIHRMIQLRVFFSILLADIYVSTRVIVMYHQYYGPSEYVESADLIFGSMVMETFISYMASLVFFLSLDRWVATKAWAWYESGAKTTILFFALQEILLYTIAISLAYLIVYDYISSMTSVYCFGVIILFGSTVFAFVFRHNLRVMREMKKGAVINKYSISRTFQIKENIDLLRTYTKVARPLVCVCIPPFAFYPVFYLVPANIGYDGLRFFSASMYHLWLSKASVVVIGCLPFYYPRLMQTIKSKSTRTISVPSMEFIEKNTLELGDAYFTLLTNDWK
ncbi:hypothetical protein PENTCL1PPCAC_25761, partial [Pristionchus entomophagus]